MSEEVQRVLRRLSDYLLEEFWIDLRCIPRRKDQNYERRNNQV